MVSGLNGLNFALGNEGEKSFFLKQTSPKANVVNKMIYIIGPTSMSNMNDQPNILLKKMLTIIIHFSCFESR